MKKTVLLLGTISFFASIGNSSNAQIGSLINSVKSKVSSTKSSSTSSTTGSNLSEADANSGVKDLLSTGLTTSVSNLNKTDAFWKSAYKILLPEPLHTADNVLTKIGMGSVADSAELRMNRAAESAVGQATPIFVNAIKQMSVQDAVGLVTGGDNSITNYFKEKTYNTLVTTFTPTVKTALDKNQTTELYSQVVTKYNAVPLVKKANPDLANYVSTKAVDALFDQISQQEKNIRTNPAAQTTSILKSVFGGSK